MTKDKDTPAVDTSAAKTIAAGLRKRYVPPTLLKRGVLSKVVASTFTDQPNQVIVGSAL